jgi:chromosome segregation ATPase
MEKNEEYKRKLEAQLKEWSARLEELKARSERLGAEARVEVERKIESLRSRRGEVRERLDALLDGGEEAWGHLRTGLEKAMADLKTGVSEALSAVRSRPDEGEEDADAEGATKPEVCVTADVPEHARFQDDGLPCDDGRGGDI